MPGLDAPGRIRNAIGYGNDHGHFVRAQVGGLEELMKGGKKQTTRSKKGKPKKLSKIALAFENSSMSKSEMLLNIFTLHPINP